MKDYKDYNEKTHLYGRFWVISALFIFLMLPVAISAHLHAFPSAQVVFKGLAPIALLFYPTAVIEVMTAGVLLFSPVLPYLTNDDSVFAPAFKQVVPALFGALGMSYFAKHFKLTVVPVAVVCLMLLFKGDLAVGVLIPVGVVVSLLSAHLMFKKGWVK